MPPVPLPGASSSSKTARQPKNTLPFLACRDASASLFERAGKGFFGEYMKKQTKNETTKNTAKTMVALFHVPERVALALQHGDGDLAEWCAELLCGGWNTDMDDRETAKWAAYVRKKFGCTEEDGESIAGVCAGFVDVGSHEETAIRAALVPPVKERNKQMEVTGEEVARKLCKVVLGRSSFADDPAGPSAGDLYTIHQAKYARGHFGGALADLADVAVSLVKFVQADTPEGARFVAATRAFIDAARWFSREQCAISSALDAVMYEGLNNAAAAGE